MRGLLRVCGLVMMVIVVLVGGLYVAHGLRGSAEVSSARRQAVSDLAAALPGAKRTALRDRDEARAVTVAKWGRPSYSWQELTCELDTVDAGWMVEKYTQSCRIQSVDLFPVSSAGPGESTVAAGAQSVTNRSCDYSDLSSLFPDEPLVGRVPWTTVQRGPSSSLEAKDPAAHLCPDDVLEPSVAGESRLLQGARPRSLDESPEWVIATVSTDVTVSDLGCSPWDVLFCSAPVDRAVMGEVD